MSTAEIDVRSGATPESGLFDYTEDQLALRKLVRDFAETDVAPLCLPADRDEQIPRELLERMADLGFFGGLVPEELGGMGLDHVTYSIVLEEMARVDHLLAVLMSMPSSLVGAGIRKFGSREQHERWLRPMAQGRLFGAAGVTEPRSGSDVAGMETTYVRDGDAFVLQGRKAWISNLDLASFFVTFASRDRSLGRKGISAFIIPADTPGLSVEPFKNKMGFRAICTGEVVLDDVILGPEHLLGDEGHGFAVAMSAVEAGRLGVASRAVGLAQACLDDSIAYAKERVVFGQPIAEYQLTKSKITDMAVGVNTARLLVHAAARSLDRGGRARMELSMAKMYATDVAQRSATEAVQIHGAYGCHEDFRVGRMYRDAKIFQIIEGPNEIHRLLIAEYLLDQRG
jgi:alkylation response protein AidB-like acyl-CoA dehydrogenase